MSNLTAPTTPQDSVVRNDDQARAHLTQIAKSTSQVTGVDTGIKEIQPVLEQHPLNGETQAVLNTHPEDNPEFKAESSELEDIYNGLQGKPRTTGALDILKEKMGYLAKKTGGSVKLVDKKK